jgi:hypothetical protein
MQTCTLLYVSTKHLGDMIERFCRVPVLEENIAPFAFPLLFTNLVC